MLVSLLSRLPHLAAYKGMFPRTVLQTILPGILLQTIGIARLPNNTAGTAPGTGPSTLEASRASAVGVESVIADPFDYSVRYPLAQQRHGRDITIPYYSVVMPAAAEGLVEPVLSRNILACFRGQIFADPDYSCGVRQALLAQAQGQPQPDVVVSSQRVGLHGLEQVCRGVERRGEEMGQKVGRSTAQQGWCTWKEWLLHGQESRAVYKQCTAANSKRTAVWD